MDTATLPIRHTPPLAAEIAALATTVPGDAGVEDLFALALLAHASAAPAGHMVVVGAGHGRAALALGAVARAFNRGRVFAIDLFPDADDAADAIDWSLDGFLAHAGAQGLLAHVLPHHGTGASFAHLMPEDFQCRLILLEGARACADVGDDVTALERHLAPGGWLCVDGAFSRVPGADPAIAAVLKRHGGYEPMRQLTPRLCAARKRD